MSQSDSSLRYQTDETPPAAVALGLGLQLAALSVSATILITTLIMRAAGQTDAYLAWAVFAAVAIGGVATMLQSVRFGRFGMGHVLMMGSSAAFIAVGIEALQAGGPAMFATLVVVAALFQFVMSHRLVLFRQVLTPTVSGTVLMLIPVSVMPAALDMLADVPEGGAAIGAPVSALATFVVICGLTLRSSGALRLWAPVIGVVSGSLIAALYGLYDTARVAEAPWIGWPRFEWPGLDLGFGPVFWTLLPGFLLAGMIGAVRTVSSAAAIQRVSWRGPRTVDFRDVQGAVNADALSNLLSGLAGTAPNTSYTSGASLAQLTGVAARRVGFAAGAVFLAMAFLPKGLALVLAIPGPVFATFLLIMIAMLFMVGVQMILGDGIDYRKSLIVGVAFWLGVAFQSGVVFPELVSEFAGGLLTNGMTTGGFVAILMTVFTEITRSRPDRMEAALEVASLPKFRKFLGGFASASGWDPTMARRLDAVFEEALLTLLPPDAGPRPGGRRLTVLAKKDGAAAVLELVSGTDARDNIEDRIARLGVGIDDARVEEELPLRLLGRLAASVRHEQYHGVDVVTVRVEPPDPPAGGRLPRPLIGTASGR